MRGLIGGLLFGACFGVVAGCPLSGSCPEMEVLELTDGAYLSDEHGDGEAPFHTDDPRVLELSGDTLTIRWTDGAGVETVETWRVKDVRTAI